jgi:hypothetical protein
MKVRKLHVVDYEDGKTSTVYAVERKGILICSEDENFFKKKSALKNAKKLIKKMKDKKDDSSDKKKKKCKGCDGTRCKHCKRAKKEKEDK